MNTVIAGLVPSVLMLIITAWWRKVEGDRKALADAQAREVADLRVHAGACTDKFHELDIRLARAETEAEGMTAAMDGLREFIDSRFNALDKRIDDLRAPPPRRR